MVMVWLRPAKASVIIYIYFTFPHHQEQTTNNIYILLFFRRVGAVYFEVKGSDMDMALLWVYFEVKGRTKV